MSIPYIKGPCGLIWPVLLFSNKSYRIVREDEPSELMKFCYQKRGSISYYLLSSEEVVTEDEPLARRHI